MEILAIQPGDGFVRDESIETLPTKGYVWLDYDRENAATWAADIERLTGIKLHEGHVKDSLNTSHPSYYDSTSDYEMLIFRSLAPEVADETFASRPTTFFLFEHLIVTVRPSDSRSIAAVKARMLNNVGRIPQRPVGLMHLITNTMIDRFLAIREPMAQQLQVWSRELLDPKHPFNDWLALMNYRSQLRILELLCEDQEDAVTQWRENTDIDLTEHLTVRINDLVEHIRRVYKFATNQGIEVESLVQMHFSAVAHRTNEIVRVLTVLSAIFLPLTLVAGIFGMNFENMPELKLHYGYFIALGGMAALAAGLLVLFRIRRWI
ncbi:MAG: magnesium transporter CorA family protein [Gammaproteobacteria bacterium]